ncbi:MAG: type VI secretion system tube protein Hcp [Deferribacterales bacterium]|nr:type VI secretion system tube protein Hcp [Deferribacterales bacterium]
MVTDFFIKIDGVDGESSEKNHSKWIEVITFNHGSVQNIAVGRAAEVSGRGQFIPFSFVHLLDKASPKLQQYCMTGQKINKVEFQVCRSIGGSQVPVYEVTMENVKIAKATVKTVAQETSAGETAYQAVEEVEMVAAKQTWKVTPIKADNTKDGAVEASFDQSTNG